MPLQRSLSRSRLDDTRGRNLPFCWRRTVRRDQVVWRLAARLPSSGHWIFAQAAFCTCNMHREAPPAFVASIVRNARAQLRADVRRIEAERLAELQGILGDFDASS